MLRIKILFAVFFLSFAVVSAQVTAPKRIPLGVSARLVMEDYLEAIGGRKTIEKVKGLFFDMSYQTRSYEYKIYKYYSFPDKLSKLLYMGPTLIENRTVSGSKASLSGVEGIRILEGADLVQLKYEAAFFGELAPERLGYTTLIDSIIHIVSGRDCYKVEWIGREGGKYAHYYDVATKLKLRSTRIIEEADGANREIVTDIQKYSEVDDIMFPFRLMYRIDGESYAIVVKDMEVNPRFDKEQFILAQPAVENYE